MFKINNAFILGEIPSTLDGPWDYKDDTEIELAVWFDTPSQELKYVYLPGSSINFLTVDDPQKYQHLTVTIAEHNRQKGRFKIHSYSVRHRKMLIKSYAWDQAASAFVETPQADGHLFKSLPSKVRFKLKLDGSGTYITINVQDIITNQFIVCDPQVENGTKT